MDAGSCIQLFLRADKEKTRFKEQFQVTLQTPQETCFIIVPIKVHIV